jgi:hypothetical protein
VRPSHGRRGGGSRRSDRTAAPAPRTRQNGGDGVSRRPRASELLQTPGALLTRSDLRELGLERRAVDAVFRECPVIVLPGYTRPMVHVEAYLALLEGATYCDRCGDRVRP